MNKITISAVTENGKRALKSYCAEYREKRESWQARTVRKALPYREEVDDLDNPSFLSVSLSKVLDGVAWRVIPKVQRSVLNILAHYGGREDDFKVIIE